MHLMDIEILLTQGQTYQMSLEMNSCHCNLIGFNTIFSAILLKLLCVELGKVVFIQQLRTLYCLSMNFTQLVPQAQQFTPYKEEESVKLTSSVQSVSLLYTLLYSLLFHIALHIAFHMDRAICILALHTALCHCQLYQSQNTLKSWQSHHYHHNHHHRR